jgi:hypothetical protein
MLIDPLTFDSRVRAARLVGQWDFGSVGREGSSPLQRVKPVMLYLIMDRAACWSTLTDLRQEVGNET